MTELELENGVFVLSVEFDLVEQDDMELLNYILKEVRKKETVGSYSFKTKAGIIVKMALKKRIEDREAILGDF